MTHKYDTINVKPLGPVETLAEFEYVQGLVEFDPDDMAEMLAGMTSAQLRDLDQLLRSRISAAELFHKTVMRQAAFAGVVAATRKVR